MNKKKAITIRASHLLFAHFHISEIGDNVLRKIFQTLQLDLKWLQLFDFCQLFC